MRIHFALLFSLLFFCTELTGQFEEFTFGGPGDEFTRSLLRNDDGSFLISGTSRSFGSTLNRAYLVKVNASGDQIWEQTYTDYMSAEGMFPRPEGGYIIMMQRASGGIGSSDDNVFIVELDEDGLILSSTYVINSDLRSTIATEDGNYLLLGQTSFNTDGCAHVVKINRQGDVLWSDCFGRAENDYAWSGLVDSEGNYLVGGISYRPGPPTGSETLLIKLTPNGDVLWEQYLGPNSDYGYFSGGIVEMPSGNYLLTELEQENQQEMNVQLHQVNRTTGASVYYTSFEQAGRELPQELISHPDGGYLLLNYSEGTDINNFDLEIKRISETLQPVWEETYGGPLNEFPYGIIILPNESLAILGNTSSFGQGARDHYLLLTDALGQVDNQYLSGQVAFDSSLNCLIDSEELLLSEWLIQVTDDNGSTYAITDDNGYYELPLAAGNYTANILSPNTNWEACLLDNPITIDGSNNVNLDFPVQSLVECPALESSTNSFFLEACNNGFIWVNYCNRGPVTADSSYILIELDSLITIDSADVEFEWVTEHEAAYPFLSLAVNECRQFRVYVTLDCEVEDVQALEIETSTVAIDQCSGEDDFDGAFLEVDARCTADEVILEISNTGMDDMAGPLEYVVIEDAVLREAMPVELAPQTSFEIELPANGSTYYLSIPQEPGAPGGSLVSTVIEGCGTNSMGDFSRGFTNQFQLTDGRRSTGEFYYPAAAAPNFENGISFPIGYGEDHQIFPNTPITYSLPFDFLTAADSLRSFLLIVEPSEYLDLGSLRVSAASHPYTVRIGANNRIEFYFTDLLAASNSMDGRGFINFELAQRPDLLSGTIIENDYRLQTDFGQFRELGSSFHTVGQNFILSNLIPGPANPVTKIVTYPNPFAETVYFELSGLPELDQSLVLQIFDAQGRAVAQEQYPAAPQIAWSRGQLAAGIYTYSLRLGQQAIASGRLVLQ